MSKAETCPRLRSLEMIFMPHPTFGKALVLRDREGIATTAIAIRADLAPIVTCLDGFRSADDVARLASRQMGRLIDTSVVKRIVADLDAAKMLDTPSFREKRREVVATFLAAPDRPAFHAGGAYDANPMVLGRFIEEQCLAKAPHAASAAGMRAICSPHMDLFRAAEGYGHAYRALADGLSSEVDTFFLLGTSHAPMRRPFAVCDKRFLTPEGALRPNHALIDKLARKSLFDVRADEYLHKAEHSIELQAVFLRHLVGDKPVSIVPILCGLGDAPSALSDPAKNADTESFLDALREIVEQLGRRAFLIAGADLAHVGPRFGDAKPLDAVGREALAARDRESITLMEQNDATGFYFQVAADLKARRVCGLGPIYTLLRALPPTTGGELLHYTQHVDSDEGSVVSHASLAFHERA